MTLLVKSRYPLVVVETIDEDFVSRRLFKISQALSMNFYSWSLTMGLRVGVNANSFYQSNEPAKMLKMVNDLLNDPQPSLFLFSDLHKFLEDAVVARLFKDMLNKIKDTRTTVAMVGAECKLPAEIAPFAARITGGYPDEKEILGEINRILADFKSSSVHIDVELGQEDLKRILKTLKGLSIQQIRNTLNSCILRDCRFDRNDLAEIEKCKKEIFDQDGILEYFGSERGNNMAGFGNLKRWLSDRKNVITAGNPGLPPPKGVLLLGVQGCGKSLAAKVIAGELSMPLYRLDLNRLYSKYLGETEENLRKALATVERLSPVCLWIDEIEKIFAASSGEIDGGVSKRVLGAMLTWMQERHDGSFIAATSNDINSLPPELLRKGRFDEIFFADLPNILERGEILRIHLIKRGLKSEDFDLGALSLNSEGFSGAELEQAVISALYSASGANEKISTKHVLEQLKLTRPLSVIKAEAVDFLRGWAKERNILPV